MLQLSKLKERLGDLGLIQIANRVDEELDVWEIYCPVCHAPRLTFRSDSWPSNPHFHCPVCKVILSAPDC